MGEWNAQIGGLTNCHECLQGETPGGVQRGTEVDDAVRVGAHEVDDLSDAEPAHLRGRQPHGVPVDGGRHRRADLEPQLAHEEVEVGVAQGSDQCCPGQAQCVEVAPFHSLRRGSTSTGGI